MRRKLIRQQTRTAKKRAEKLSLELAIKRGKYVRLDEFKADIIRANLALKQYLLGLPIRLAPAVAAQARVAGDQHKAQVSVYEILTTAIREALSELSRGIDLEGKPHGE